MNIDHDKIETARQMMIPINVDNTLEKVRQVLNAREAFCKQVYREDVDRMNPEERDACVNIYKMHNDNIKHLLGIK